MEDVATTRKLIRQLLAQGVYQVLEADDAATALYIIINEHRPMLTLLDVHRPAMSGPAVAQLISQHPFVILTEDRDEALFEQIKNAGALTHFLKPLQSEIFLRQIEMTLKQSDR